MNGEILEVLKEIRDEAKQTNERRAPRQAVANARHAVVLLEEER